MKRRKFIQAALVTGAAPMVAQGSERLYGAPGSLLPAGGAGEGQRFTVPFVNAGLPVAGWNDFAGIASAIEGVLGNRTDAARFSANPREYFASKGLDASDKTLMDESTIMLSCLSNPVVQESLAERKYDDTLSYFEAAGLFEPRDPSELEKRLKQVIDQNMAEVRALVGSKSGALTTDQEQLLVEVLESSGVKVTEDDFAIVAEIMKSASVSPMALVPVLVVVVIVALAAAYIAAAVGATVALMAGFAVSLSVALAVVASGDKSHGLVVNEKAPFDGSMARLDPALTKNAERAIRMARVMGDPQLEIHVLKETVHAEVSAFMKALRDTDILAMDERQLSLAIKATTAYSYRVLGI